MTASIPTDNIALPEMVSGPPIVPAGRPSKVNPYDTVIKSLSEQVDANGYSPSFSHAAAISPELAKVHASMIRRAGAKLGVGISVLLADVEGGLQKVTFGVVPKRVRKTKDNGEITTPEVEAPAAK